jgi:hypothetical protein
MVRAELFDWGLGSVEDVDPADVLLRLIAQSAARAARYAAELEHLEGESDLHGALVGTSTFVDGKGVAREVGEHVRAMAKLEAQERDRLSRFSALAVGAGIALRQVELSERQAALMGEVLRTVLSDPVLGLSGDQRAAVPGVIRRHLGLAPPPALGPGPQSA